MPIKKENLHRYPPDWKALALSIKEEVGWRCEWCSAEHGQPAPISGKKVVLTIAHLDHTPENCARENLKCLCQRCHFITHRTRGGRAMSTQEWLDLGNTKQHPPMSRGLRVMREDQINISSRPTPRIYS
jgi:hypothetical protein